jgi:hypothetical protein
VTGVSCAWFARQVPIGPYVVDFCCRERKLIVELDGGQHARRAAYDAGRTAFMERLGYRVLRFWDNEALGNTDGVLQRIAQALTDPSPPALSRGGRGKGGGAHAHERGEGEERGTLAPGGGEGRVRGHSGE